LKILFVENHERFAQTVIKYFLSDYFITLVPSIAEAKAAFATETFDLALIDYDLDDGKGTELVQFLLAQERRPLMIAVSSHAEGNAALQEAGTDGVCRKADFAHIQTVISDLMSQNQSPDHEQTGSET
jgi:DNA-binding response OmpR family regulator